MKYDIIAFRVSMVMADGIAFEDAPKNESAVAEAQRLRGGRFLQASRMFGRRAVRALVDTLVIYLPMAIGANVGGAPGLFVGAWLGSEILKRLDERHVKEKSAEIKNRTFSEAAMMFGGKAVHTLSDAVRAAIPPMIGALIGGIIPIPGAVTAGALIGAWFSTRWLRNIRAKREK